MIDVIIPTISGREEYLERAVASVADHATPVVIEDSETCGAGWREGLEWGSGDYVLFFSDDLEVVSPSWAEVCTQAADEGHIACPRIYRPDRSIESQGGDMNAPLHLVARPRKDRTPVDYATVPFLRRDIAERIGVLDVHYASDVWISYRGRQLGYESILRHGFDLVHHQAQVGRGAGMSQPERDAMDCATVFEELGKCQD